MIKYHFTILLFFVLIPIFTFPQIATDEQLAIQYFQSKEYDKAISLYEKLYYEKKTPFYYNYYLDCLIGLKEYDGAEKFVKKISKKLPANLSYLVDLGYIYQTSGSEKMSEKTFKEAINKLSGNRLQTLELADAFLKRNLIDNAIQTYIKGRKQSGYNYDFAFELANLYGKKNEYQLMINEYINILDANPSMLSEIQAAMQDELNNDSEGKKSAIFRNTLLYNINNNPDNYLLIDFLFWYYIQEKDFQAAFIQAKALDKRRYETGERIYNLGLICQSNNSYKQAIECFEYIISKKGSDSPYYYQSKIQLLESQYQYIISSYNYNIQDLKIIEKAYKNTLSEIGINKISSPLIRNLAHLEAFYLNNSQEAINLLNDALSSQKLPFDQQAYCKIELGDILLMTGEPWEATLLYSQVEKSLKNDPIGHEAKFKNARLFYYIGEFDFAKGQLDILRAATSKLIANDAMLLSLTISDNIGEDSSTVELTFYSKADFFMFQNKDSLALVTLDSIKMLAISHPLFDEVLMKKAEIKLKQGKFSDADSLLQKLIESYPDDILTDKAIFTLADLKENKFNDKEKAKELYKTLLEKYPGSIYTVEARKRFRALRGDKIN